MLPLQCNGTQLIKNTLVNKFALFLLLTGCAGFLNKIPERDVYRYTDLYQHQYNITLAYGEISDTSWVLDSSGKEIEVLKWKYHEKGVLSIDTIVGRNEGLKDSNSCDTNKNKSCRRSTESILKVIRKETPKLKGVYNKYLYGTSFGGKVTVQFKIDPEGNVRYLYIKGNTTGVHDFALDVLKKINTWKFEKVEGQSLDVVTVPFTFSP